MATAYSISDLPPRISKKIKPCNATGCWEWTASLDKHGYGHVAHNGETRQAHRVVYQLLVGELDNSLVIDHLCRNTSCVNPAHLDQVSQKTNTLRGTSFSAVNAKKQFCNNGHPLTNENTYIRPNGNRDCRACIRDRVAIYKTKKKASDK